ncbi:Phosphatidylinositol 4-kinase stt4 [Batrachochytrium dendrobatidis]|nr:phosphatidylinositol-4- kinase [Batrachochytrium dendrobatidis]KAK5665827.1 Phosphatidylinositol 4-kinase stt4 [Batrachochytrium dendrobatidis]
MFYRRDLGSVSLVMLSEAAEIIGTLAVFGRTELDHIQKCTKEVAKFSDICQQAIEKAELRDTNGSDIGIPFPTISEQMNVLGILELLPMSSESDCEKYIPYCLEAVKFISHVNLIIEESEYNNCGVLAELDSFLYELCTRMFRISAKHPSCAATLTSAMWKWAKDLHAQISETTSHFHIRLTVAALIGMHRSFKMEWADIVFVDALQLAELAEAVFSEEKIQIVTLAWSMLSTEWNIAAAVTTDYGSLNWVASFVNALQELLAGSLQLEEFDSNTLSEKWTDLAKSKSESKNANTPVFLEVVSLLFKLCSNSDWHQWVAVHSNSDQELLCDVVSSATKTAVLCALHNQTLHASLLLSLLTILQDPGTGEESTFLDLYLTAIEGLEIMAASSPSNATSAVKNLISFMVDPAPIFIFALDEHTCAILREAACQSLSNILSSCIDSNQRKTALYTFVNTMHATHQLVFSATTAATDAGRRYQNSISAIASLCSALKTKETIDVAIPALARRLDDSPTIFDEFIWKNLGNIGLSDDVEVFRQIVTFIIDYSKRTFSKISKISHTLARMSGRAPALLEIYLEKLLVLFLEKAAGLQRNLPNSNVIAELRDIMSIVKMICEQESFHPQSLLTTSQDILNHFRNVWLYLILFVLTPAGTWPKEWHSMLRVVASKTPPLILDKQCRSLEADLGANSIMQGVFPDTIVSKIKGFLSAMMPTKVLELRALSFQASAYLLAVYHIESMRIRIMSVDFMCRYLVDERLYNTDIYTILEMIADEVLRLFMHSQPTKRVDTRAMEHNMQCMLLYSAHRLSRSRKFATRWILQMLDHIPCMLWNHKVAFLMMDILRYLDTRKAGFSEDGFKNPLLSKLFYIDQFEATSASVDYFAVGKAWFKASIHRSFSETIGVVQTYLVEISNKSPYTALNDHSDLMVLLSQYTGISEIASTIIKSPSKHSRFLGEIKGMFFSYTIMIPDMDRDSIFKKISVNLKHALRSTYKTTDEPNFAQRLNHTLFRSVALIISNSNLEAELIQLVCRVPNIMFDPTVMEIAVSAWGWLMSCRPDLAKRVLLNLVQVWGLNVDKGQGLYGFENGSNSPFLEKMGYGASTPAGSEADDSDVHTIWIRFLIDRYRSDRLRGEDHIQIYVQLFQKAACVQNAIRSNWTAREARFDLASLGIKIALDLEAQTDKKTLYIWTLVFNITLGWFERPPMFGRIKVVDLKKLIEFYHSIKDIKFSRSIVWTTSKTNRVLLNCAGNSERVELSDAQALVTLLFEHELCRLATWIRPLEDNMAPSFMTLIPPSPNERQIKWASIVRTAWSLNPVVAVHLPARFLMSSDTIEAEISEVSKFNEISCIECPEAVALFLRNSWRYRTDDQLRFLLYWAPVPPIQAISMLGHPQRIQPWLLQYAVRVLEFFPIDQVFFFIPQMVQALRDDSVGYIERFILDAAKTSQAFAHQIIWNMKANMYKDEACDIPDAIKPALDRIIHKITSELSGLDKDLYEREFDFFGKVTGISGTLKPFVQADASKIEKKRKIDEELRKIKVQVGVYLPTNPESIVVDIDYDSGRPLQSHAKAPFMASFKVNESGNLNGETRWMSSIFKVGDDCRQDVLALQLISIFKSIFVFAGLDLYTFPYRVVATAPGCGVIEVIPKSISRDMMGREKVNSLYDWFIAEFGPEDGVDFQKARKEFVKSLAAYSLIMFILQIKDRHNGNIMFDKEGHMIHIDFGFILSIAPGGGILEVSPFKLTAEMVQVMGGDITSPSYRLFSELCVKAYLACRPYAEEIISMVSLMMDSGLPCFKGDTTIRKLRERFQLEKSEKGAAEFMVNCIRQSHENTRSGLYDTFQYLQNGIPYK